MQATCAGQPRRVGRFQRGEPIPQQRLGVAQRQVLAEPLRADARPLGEHTLEMRGAHVHFGGQFLKRGGRPHLIHKVDGAAHDLEMIAFGLHVHRGPRSNQGSLATP